MGRRWRCLRGELQSQASVQGRTLRAGHTFSGKYLSALGSIYADQVGGQSPQTRTALPAPLHCGAVTAVTQDLRECWARVSAEAKESLAATLWGATLLIHQKEVSLGDWRGWRDGMH